MSWTTNHDKPAVIVAWSVSQSRHLSAILKAKKLKPDKFFMASHLKTTGFHRSMVSQFYLQPDIKASTPCLNPSQWVHLWYPVTPL